MIVFDPNEMATAIYFCTLGRNFYMLKHPPVIFLFLFPWPLEPLSYQFPCIFFSCCSTVGQRATTKYEWCPYFPFPQWQVLSISLAYRDWAALLHFSFFFLNLFHLTVLSLVLEDNLTSSWLYLYQGYLINMQIMKWQAIIWIMNHNLFSIVRFEKKIKYII